MTYQNLAKEVTQDQIVAMLKGLDQIRHTIIEARPGHVAYNSKKDLIRIATDAMPDFD